MRFPSCSRLGFTLIEMAIVLVVMALIVGGVLGMQTLIRQAKLRGVVNQAATFRQAIVDFRDKYQALPGDFTGATALWGTLGAGTQGCTGAPTNPVPLTVTCDGDGDGRITTQATDTTASQYEQFRAWQHLANANLVDGKYSGVAGSLDPQDAMIGTNVPAGSLDGSGFALISLLSSAAEAGNGEYSAHYYSGVNYRHILQFGADLGTASFSGNKYSSLLGPILSTADAKALDDKIDDGAPGSGNVMAERSDSPYSPNCTDSTSASSAKYAATQTGLKCSLTFLLGF